MKDNPTLLIANDNANEIALIMLVCKIKIVYIFELDTPINLISLISFFKSCALNNVIINNKITDIAKIMPQSANTICLLKSMLCIDALRTCVGVIACNPGILDHSVFNNAWSVGLLDLTRIDVKPP